jgi:hypothetical protein
MVIVSSDADQDQGHVTYSPMHNTVLSLLRSVYHKTAPADKGGGIGDEGSAVGR